MTEKLRTQQENLQPLSKERSETTLKEELTLCLDNIPFIMTEQSTSNFNLNKNSPSIFSLRFNSGTILTLDSEKALTFCPCLSEEITEMMLPEWITENNLTDYFIYAKSDQNTNHSFTPRILLRIADFFLNQQVVSKLILFEIIPFLTKENSLEYLEYTQNKVKENVLNHHWMALFSASMKSVILNLPNYLSSDLNAVKRIDRKTLDEIIEKYKCFYLKVLASDS